MAVLDAGVFAVLTRIVSELTSNTLEGVDVAMPTLPLRSIVILSRPAVLATKVGDATGYSAASGTVWLWELYSSGVTRTAKGNVASTGTKSISLSSDGYRFRNSSDSGTTYTYKWNGSSWEQVGSSFSFPYGTVNVSRSAASRNESILVISDGTKRSNLSFLSVGVVYTYTLDGSSPTKSIYSRGLGWTESANSTSTSLYPVASPTAKIPPLKATDCPNRAELVGTGDSRTVPL